MNIRAYLHQEVEVEEWLGCDNEYRVDEYKPIEVLPTREEGGTKLIMRSDGSIYQSSKWYWLDRKIGAKTKINGQLVIETKEFYGLKGEFIYLEAYV